MKQATASVGTGLRCGCSSHESDPTVLWTKENAVATLRVSVRVHSLLVMCALVSAVLMPIGAAAQALGDVKTPDTPLVLKAQGSFFVGGETVEQTQGQLGNLGPGGHITINQMYVRFMVPQGGEGNVPVVMLHGATLTG